MSNLPILQTITFHVVPCNDITEDVLVKCASLFSEHYGLWATSAHEGLSGKRVRLNADRLRQQCLWNANCSVVLALLPSGELIGQAFFVKFPFKDGYGIWITQLVVHTDYRNRGIAAKLCAETWDPHCTAWGLVTSHPYSVKALEHASGGQKCNPSTIAKYTTELVKASGVPYVQDKELRVGQNESVIATGFHVDHTEVDAIAAGLSNWNLGKLNPGDEYFAFIVKE